MAEKLRQIKEFQIERPERARLSAKESLKRMEEFQKRKEKWIATVRESQDRSLSP